jgi:hypothetical protein
VEDFEAKIELDHDLQNSLTILKTQAEKGDEFGLKFTVKNKSDRSYTLSFPDAQRYDIQIFNSAGTKIYDWSDDKKFEREVGKTFVNRHESISFTPDPSILLSSIVPKLVPGDYKIVVFLSNYPEIKAETPWRVLP